MSRDELFAEVSALEDKVFDLLNDDSRQHEFDAAIERTAELTEIARSRGWL